MTSAAVETYPSVALTIAGSEATGGAGAQADLKTFQELGTYGITALTCIVSFDPKDNWNHRFVPVDPGHRGPAGGDDGGIRGRSGAPSNWRP